MGPVVPVTYNKNQQRITMAKSALTNRNSPLVQETREIFNHYYASSRRWSRECHLNVLLRKNAPFTDEEAALLKSLGVPVVAIAHIHRVRRQYLTKVASRSPSFKATGRGPEDQEMADTLSELFFWIFEGSELDGINQGSYLIKQLTGDDFDRGRGLLHVGVNEDADQGRGEIFVGLIDNDEFYVDPNSRDPLFDDATHMILRRQIVRSVAEAAYPKKKRLFGKVSWMKGHDSTNKDYHLRHREEGQVVPGSASDTYNDKAILFVRYERVMKTSFHVQAGEIERVMLKDDYNEWRDEEAFFVTAKEETAFVSGAATHEWLLRYEDGIKAQDIEYGLPASVPIEVGQAIDANGQQVPNIIEFVIEPTTNGMLLDLGSQGVDTGMELEVKRRRHIRRITILGDVLLYDEVLPITRYPIVPMMTNHDGNPFPIAEISLLRPLVEAANKIDQKTIEWLTRAANWNIMYEEGSMTSQNLDEDLANPGKYSHAYQVGSAPPTAWSPPQLPNEVFALGAIKAAQLNEISGQYPRDAGDPASAPNTYSQDLLDQERAQQLLTLVMHSLNMCLARVARIIQELIPSVYTHEKVFRLTRPGSQARTLNKVERDPEGNAISLNYDVRAATYDITIVPGSTLPTPRMAKAQIVQELMTTETDPNVRAALQEVLFDHLDMPEVKEALEKADRMRALEQALEQAQQEIKKKENLIGRMESEIRHAERGQDRAKAAQSVEGPRQAVLMAAKEAKKALEEQTKATQEAGANEITNFFGN